MEAPETVTEPARDPARHRPDERIGREPRGHRGLGRAPDAVGQLALARDKRVGITEDGVRSSTSSSRVDHGRINARTRYA